VVVPFTRKRSIKGLEEPILFSRRIQLSSEVKYLGIILDEGLSKLQRMACLRITGAMRTAPTAAMEVLL
jgi:hypothetical protein